MSSHSMNIIQASFFFDVPADLNKFESFEFIVGQVPWHFSIRKLSNDDENKNGDKFQVSLVCKYSAESTAAENTKWSIEAEAKIKLCSFNQCVQPIEKIISLTKFHDDCMSSEAQSMSLLDGKIDGINLDNFIRCGHFRFEATVKSKPLRLKRVRASTFSSTTFGIVINKIKDLTTCDTPTFSLQGIEWYVKFKREHHHLGVYLCHRHRPDDFAWTVYANWSMQLLPIDESVEPIEAKLRTRYDSGRMGYGIPEFIAWKDLIDETQMYVNNNAFFEITIETEPLQPFWKHKQAKLNNYEPSTPKCPVCYDKFIDQEICSTVCGHLYCDGCIRKVIERTGKCSLCNEDASASDLRVTYLN